MHSIVHNSVLPVAKELTHYFSIPAILSVFNIHFFDSFFLYRFFCCIVRHLRIRYLSYRLIETYESKWYDTLGTVQRGRVVTQRHHGRTVFKMVEM